MPKRDGVRPWRRLVLPLIAVGVAGALWRLGAARPRAAPSAPARAAHAGHAVADRFAPPAGYALLRTTPGSFAEWLTRLPLKPGKPPVLLHDGRRKPRQDVHAAVLDIDVGDRDLQQCADAIIRLRAEYLYSMGRYSDIHFNFTSGDRADFAKWAEGYRPLVAGNHVRWSKLTSPNRSYASFRQYLDTVFRYAGTLSLSKELVAVADPAEISIGDVFIRGGSPGHAVIVLNVAVHDETGERLFLPAQSYMPAQDIHVLKNPTDPSLSPWYRADFGETLATPEYSFRRDELKRFRS